MVSNTRRLEELKDKSEEYSRKAAIAQSQVDDITGELKDLAKELKSLGINSIKELSSSISTKEEELDQILDDAEKELEGVSI